MDFDYTDDQKQLRDDARRFLAHACPITRVREVLDDPDQHYSAELWREIGAMGWLGANVPEAHGGLGLGGVELCALAEELGRALAPVPFASTVYVLTEALLLAGSDEQRQRLLPRIVEGSVIGALATAEPGRGALPRCTVRDGRLDGVKSPVTDGAAATHAIVSATEDGKLGLYLVDLAEQGVERTPLATLDPARGAARLTFSGTPAERLDGGAGAEDVLQSILDRAAAFLAFEQVGGADRALEMARDYALERRAFGRAIAGYQAIKHRMADMYVRNQIARSHAYHAAWAITESPEHLGRTAAAARVAASDAYWFAAKEAIEIFGGLGATWEADGHLHYRRAKQLSLVLGSPVTWRERLAGRLEAEFGRS